MAYMIQQLLASMIENEASDLHIHVGNPPGLRINGSIVSIEGPALTADETEKLVFGQVPQAKVSRLASEGSCDFAFTFRNSTRIRINAFREHKGYGMILRLLPSALISLDELRMPALFKDLLRRSRGLILVTGSTGSGKSTTLAAMINWINENESSHIITIEDPIEYVHLHKKCLITQREVGVDLPTFAEGIRSGLRQDPDVILVGEMRDLETIDAAVSAAETGHLVLATLHTSGATRSIDRIIEAFPSEERNKIRAQLATSLTAITSQCLLRTMNNQRVAAFEIMTRTDGVAAKIRDGKTYQLITELETGSQRGMRSLDSDLLSLVQQGIVSEAEALTYSQEPKDLATRIHTGIGAL